MMWAYLLPALIGALTGTVAGGLLAWWLLALKGADQGDDASDPTDPWLDAEIDQAAATWAVQHGRPEAAPLMADKLHLLHKLGQRRGWS